MLCIVYYGIILFFASVVCVVMSIQYTILMQACARKRKAAVKEEQSFVNGNIIEYVP